MPATTPGEPSLSWAVTLFWLAALLVGYCYGMRDWLPREATVPVSVPGRIAMFFIMAAMCWLLLLPFSGVIWRRLPRARGVLILLTVLTCLLTLMAAAGPRTRIGAGAVAWSGIKGTCMPLSAASNRMSPPEIYTSVGDCLARNQVEAGARLHLFGAAYGFFDTMRVRDRSAHQAAMAMPMLALQKLEPARRDHVRKEFLRIAKDRREVAAVCRELRRIGPPSYEPRYMIEHGMAAFTGNKEPALVPGFDAAFSWKLVLDQYLHCPVGG